MDENSKVISGDSGLFEIETSQEIGNRNQVSFSTKLHEEGINLRKSSLDTLQVNVGKLCNQACRHCHVDASPKRTEIMTLKTIDRILTFLKGSDIQTVDITGGAPELNPNFRYFVRKIRSLDRRVMVRCNLTVIFQPGLEDLPKFYRENEIVLVCSMPCYLEENVDEQRGQGVFVKSIEALQILNKTGYASKDSRLELHLVYNPVGATLPPPQDELEASYREELFERYGIVFNSLYTITNMPIRRFNDYLKRKGQYKQYMQTLKDNFNLNTVGNLMCKELISVDWRGNIYDCDFNQMLEIHLERSPKKIWEVSPIDLIDKEVCIADHCFGCTAGAGSSCAGSLV